MKFIFSHRFYLHCECVRERERETVKRKNAFVHVATDQILYITIDTMFSFVLIDLSFKYTQIRSKI
jgi:hypothetical protein